MGIAIAGIIVMYWIGEHLYSVQKYSYDKFFFQKFKESQFSGFTKRGQEHIEACPEGAFFLLYGV
jgi:hypothetical protein